MIEIVKENEKNYGKREIPKNLKTIGNPQGNESVYIEDYIETFIKQIAMRDDCPKVLILYGDSIELEGSLNHFICGAILADGIKSGENNIFDDSVWKDINMKATHYFPKLHVMGWAYIRYDLAEFAEERVCSTHNQYFTKQQKVYIEYAAIEKQEQVFLFRNAGIEKQYGYYIYYESNEAMQNYMVTIKQDEPEEIKPEVDSATKKYRGIVREKKEELHQKQTMGMLYGTSLAMLLVITIVGVTLMNNYTKMRDMEKILTDISEQVSEKTDSQQAFADIDTSNSDMDVTSNDDKPSNPIELALEDDTASDEAVEETAISNDGASAEGVAEEVSADGDASLIDNLEMDAALAEGDNPPKIVDVAENNNTLENSVEINNDQLNPNNQTLEQKSLTETQNAAEVVPNEQAAPVNFRYRIEKGDTLSKISMKFYGDEDHVDQICQTNQIKDKNSILYGVNIVLP